MDDSGKALRATIYDFKTDTIIGENGEQRLAELYRGQLLLYRQAVIKLLDLPPNSARTFLALVRLGKIVEIR